MILYCRRKYKEKHLQSSSHLPSVSMSRILASPRYAQLQSEDEDNEINEKEIPTESFLPNKENPYQDDSEPIYEYAQT